MRFNITVNVIAPGYVDTDMVAAVSAIMLGKIVAKISVERLGLADVIARAVMFFAVDDATLVKRASMTINGGQLMY